MTHFREMESFDSNPVATVMSALLFVMWLGLLFPISFFVIEGWPRWTERYMPRAWVIRPR